MKSNTILTLRFWAKVKKGAPDECWPWTAAHARDGYGKFGTSHSKWQRAHRVAYEIAVGPIPPGMMIDHTCNNPDCVNPSHLRLATPSQNRFNTRRYRSNRCGLKGVSWFRKTKKWRARIQAYGIAIIIGYFDDPNAAHLAYCAAARELHGEFANAGGVK